MKNFRKKQNGFSVVEIIAVCAVVGVIGLFSVVLFRHHKTSSNAQTTPTTAGSGVKPESTSTQPAQTAEQYLVVKDWGMQFPLSDVIKDAYYSSAKSGTGDDGKPNTIWLGLTSLNNNGCDVSAAGPTSTNNPVGSIIRVLPSERDPVTNKLYTEQNPGGVTVGKYYYVYSPWDNSCASKTSLQAVNSAFVTSVKNISAK